MTRAAALLLGAALLAVAALVPLRRQVAITTGLERPPAAGMAVSHSLGDRPLAARRAALTLQIGGDGGGRRTRIESYDFSQIIAWLTLLDRLDPRNQQGPAIAAYLYGATRRPEQLQPILNYLRRRALADPARDWSWLAHAVYLGRSRLADGRVGQRLALDLAALPGTPDWTRTLALAIAHKDGDRDAARAALAAIRARGPLSPREAAFVEELLREAK